MAEQHPPAPSSKPVGQKLRLKPGSRALVLNGPEGYLDVLLGGVDSQTDIEVAQQLEDSQTFDVIQVFVTRRDELLASGPRLRAALKPGGALWISYPKGKVIPTDLNRDVVRVAAEEVGLEVVSQVAIDEVWSALRAKVIEARPRGGPG